MIKSFIVWSIAGPFLFILGCGFMFIWLLTVPFQVVEWALGEIEFEL